MDYQARMDDLIVIQEDKFIMTGKRYGNLSFLEGKLLIGVVQTLVSQFDEKGIYRLIATYASRTYSENELTLLSKKGLLGDDQLCKLQFCECCVFNKLYKTKFGNT